MGKNVIEFTFFMGKNVVKNFGYQSIFAIIDKVFNNEKD